MNCKSLYIILIIIAACGSLSAQNDGEEVFGFLRYPMSARANALGGYNISLVEADASLILQNPGLLGPEMDRVVSLSYTNFMSAVNVGSAIFAKAYGENAAWAIAAAYANYGTLRRTGVNGEQEGTFSVGDMSLSATYSRNLSERWRGGLSIKFLYSSLERYSSIGLAADAGLSYYNSDAGFSFGLTLKNAGAQLKSYYDARYPLPLDIQIGASQLLAHAPFRISLTATSLNRWDINILDHFVAGLDFVPTDNFWLGLGYNAKTATDMKLSSGNGLGGFSAGGGIRVKNFDASFSVARYHPSSLSLMIGIAMQY